MADNPAKNDPVLFCPTGAAVLGRRRDAALIFCFVLHQGKMKNKPAGALEKRTFNTPIQSHTLYHLV
jgi:hypothetical protein